MKAYTSVLVLYTLHMLPNGMSSPMTPYHMIRHLWQHTESVETFVSAWQEAVDWYKKVYEQLDTSKKIENFVTHCGIVHREFFAHLCVDQAHQRVYWIDTEYMDEIDTVYIPLHCSHEYQRTHACGDWYALYFDCVAQVFLAALWYGDNGMLHKDAGVQALTAYTTLCELITYLEHTAYHARYAQQLRRYQELLQCAQVYS